VDNWEQPHPEPPGALRKYMSADLWVLRDANWSPDFTASADVARALYAQDRGVQTDGAIALDLEAVRQLVSAVGPLQVPGIQEPVTGDNALNWMKAAWQSPVGSTAGPGSGGAGGDAWWSKRKDFMGELVKAALAKVQSGADLDMLALARVLYSTLEARHIQVTVDDASLAALLAQRGWDGALRPPADADFLMLVDSNVGFNKANLFVRPALDYEVREVSGALVATLTVTYTHTAASRPDLVCDRLQGYGPTYEDLAARCYWDFVRVYVPGGSELLSANGLNSVATEPGEAGTTAFTGDFVLRPGEVKAVTLRYRLPAAVRSQPYRLLVHKQAGTAGWPLNVAYQACRQKTALNTDYHFECPPVIDGP
jgi:hypothetical protein